MSRKLRGFRQALRLETLERRELFAGDLMVSQPVFENQQTPAERLATYVNSKWFADGTLNELQRFSSRAQLEDKLATLVTGYWKGVFDKPVKDVGLFYTFDFLQYDQILQPGPIVQLANATTNASSEALSFGTGRTNVQVAGIDESDSVDVTDDGFLYISTLEGISVVDIRDPANMAAANKAIGGLTYGASLIVSGNRLISLSSVSNEQSLYGTTFKKWSYDTRVEIYDITNRLTPKSIASFEFEGSQSAARVSNGRLTLVTNSYNILTLPEVAVVRGSDGVDRFESASTYLARNRSQLLSAILPNYRTGDAGQSQDIGTWDDIAIGAEQLNTTTSVIRLDISGQTPALIGSELLVGLNNMSTYMAGDNLYLYGINPELTPWGDAGMGLIARWPSTQTKIFKFNTASDGEVSLLDSVVVPVSIQDSRWMSEHKGVLRVAGRSDVGADIYTIGNSGTDWKILGKLQNLAPQQTLLSAYFEGDRALVTTGEVSVISTFFGDPLHGIDLSDPANPKELSELVIPGFTTYLQKIDATHWIGIGYDVSSDSTWLNKLQISLYEASDLANPRVIDTWVSDENRVSAWGQVDALAVNYDAKSGLLTLATAANSMALVPGRVQLQSIFRIDVKAADPLKAVETIAYPESVNRTFVFEDHLFSITNSVVIAQKVNDLSKSVGQVYISQPAEVSLYRQLTPGETSTFYLLAGWDASKFSIESVVVPSSLTANVSSDGQMTVQVPANASSFLAEVLVKYRYNQGPVTTIRVTIEVYNPIPTPPVYSDAPAKILARFEDNQGKVVDLPQAGDEVWVVLSARDMRTFGQGVFAAYFDVTFNSANLTVVGEPEYLTQFTNGREALSKANGFSSLGAFGDSTPDSTEPQDVVRFRVRVTDDQPVSLSIDAAKGIGNEFLLYGEPGALKLENIAPTTLGANLGSQAAGEANSAHDFNGDGVISGLDVLQIVNYINAAGSTNRQITLTASTVTQGDQLLAFDLTGDGSVTGLDVLQVVNAINARGIQSLRAVGEGEASPAILIGTELANSALWAVDQVFAEDPTSDIMRKSRRS